ncbi:MAG: FtsX-like permease family protein [Deltaproteobacteria bacterium]|nr:FtsX-like permease family protein [Deltaproteobacteria bacterium]
MLLLKMAFRNLWRRKSRTILTMIAIGFSYGLLLFFVQFTTGSHEGMIDTGVRMQAGHVVVQAKGYSEERKITENISKPELVLQQIKEIVPDSNVAQRIFLTGSLSSSSGNTILDNLVGVKPAVEKKISQIPEKLIKGKFLSGTKGEIVIGATAAKLLKVDLGMKVQLSISDVNGNIKRSALRVRGIFKTGGLTVDRGYALISLKQTQELTKMDSAVTQLAIFTDLASSEKIASRLKTKLNTTELDVLHWRDAMPMLAQMLWVDTISMYVFLFIILGIVSAGILNTVLMSVMERTREFGVLKSIGMSPWRIFMLIMYEAVFTAIIAIFVGMILGLSLSYYLSIHGLDPAVFVEGEQGMEAAGIPMTNLMYSKVTLYSVVWTAISVIVLSVLSALPPSIRAFRIKPVKAVRDL